MLFRKTVAAYCENHMKHTNTLCEQDAGFIMSKQVVHILTTGLYLYGFLDVYFPNIFFFPVFLEQLSWNLTFLSPVLSCALQV
jgi:hypothetical protein